MSLILTWVVTAFVQAVSLQPARASIAIHDNTRPAGALSGNVLTVRLVAGRGTWQPQGPQGKAREVAALGEEGRALTIPGPLLRAREGTAVVLTLRNTLPSELRMTGFCAKPGPCQSVVVPIGATREFRFTLNGPGTFYYWGSTSATTIAARSPEDSQLGGALVVDPRSGAINDRILVVSIFGQTRGALGCGDPARDEVAAINGATWPHTSRLKYSVGETARWRVINLSCDGHAMHLHGFHFRVNAAGDGNVDGLLSETQMRTAVTEFLPSGRTFSMSWTPTRAGNWLFHCHMVVHMAEPPGMAGHDHNDAAGMTGLVIGVEVTGQDSETAREPARRLRLLLSEEAKRYGDASGYRMDLEGVDAPRLDAGPVPAPVLVLRRGEPVEITVVNRMREPTGIHWHGIEIDSYFDGVPGFGGRTGSLAPAIEPGQSFVVRFTPPRAGTFIYHTHWHDERQLAGGLYGALIVLEPGESYDQATDHVVVIGLNGVLIPGEREPFALNGRANPAPIRMRAGVANRIRLINITANNVALTVSLINARFVDPSPSVGRAFETTQWKPIAKDGAALPADQTISRTARQVVAVGETYDFEVTPALGQLLWLEVRRGVGEWVIQAPIEIR